MSMRLDFPFRTLTRSLAPGFGVLVHWIGRRWFVGRVILNSEKKGNQQLVILVDHGWMNLRQQLSGARLRFCFFVFFSPGALPATRLNIVRLGLEPTELLH